MQLLNHLRNSTRDDIRNAVKTVLDYLNSADLSAAFAPHYSFAPNATSVAYRADGGLLCCYEVINKPHNVTQSTVMQKLLATIDKFYDFNLRPAADQCARYLE